jgi:hypothetical protein
MAQIVQVPPVAEDRLVAAMKLVLDGKDLACTSLKDLRRAVADHLDLGQAASDGIGKDGLDNHKDWFNDVAQPIVDAIASLLPAMQGPPDWLTPMIASARSYVTLVTLSAVLDATVQVAHPPLRTLHGVTREIVRDAVLDALTNPALSTHGGRARETVDVAKLVVFLEIPWHFHVAIQFRQKYGFLPFKKALRLRSRLASHWSTSHTEWCTALRYGCFASEKKLAVDKEPLCWTSDGRAVDLFGESNAHYSESAHKRCREVAAMHPDPSKKQKREMFEKLDLTSLILCENLKTPAQIIAFVKRKGSAVMREWVHKQQGRLREYLQHAQEWRDAEEVASFEAESDWDLVQRVAKEKCACQGECKWWLQAKAFFDRNSTTIDRHRVAACFLDVLRSGPSKTR